ncbi:hypothetical protein [Kitasatospora sp. NE20-6]|uniref:hypothetical protein n=1 Tax=Kitasatospora sp. NE20-6 TaxID=2859066 RepID=UPI0038B40178
MPGTGLPGAAAFAHGASDDPFGTAAQAAAIGDPGDDGPKTETTLTTRIRINIPGSRPIPPVVVRSPVKNEEPAAAPAPAPAPAPEPGAPRHRANTGGSPVLGVMDSGTSTATPELPPEWQEPRPGRPDGSNPESTGEWFRPRPRGRQDGPPAGSPAPAAAAAPQAAPQAAPRRPGPPQAAGPRGPVIGEQRQAPRPTGAPATPFAGNPDGGPQDPFAGAQDPFSAPPQDPYAARPQDAFAGARNPYAPPQDPFAAPPQDPYAAQPQEQTGPGRGRPPAGRFADDPFAVPAPGHDEHPQQHAADPFAGGAGQDNPFRSGPADPFAAGRAAAAAAGEPEDTQIGGFEPIRDDVRPGGIPGTPAADPFGTAPAVADPFAAPYAPPQAADPFAADRPADPFGGFPGAPGPGAPAPEPVPAPAAAPPAETETPAAPPAPARRRGRGRKLVTYAVVGVLFVGAAAYGTGLMLNQADIPKGTTVLGTDIGGDTRDQAVSTLDGTVAKTGREPLKLKLAGQALTLDPTTAGLSFDTTATVDGLTSHSYSPVEVIGSLTGGSKAVAPEVKVDRAKLKAALEELAGKAGQGLQEGRVEFTATGQTQVVAGKPGQALDPAAAADQVEQAYRKRAAGLAEGEIALTLTAAQPKVGEDALKAAAAGLGKQVLAGNVTLKAGTKKWDFGKLTASRALTLAPDASGKIVLTWDLAKLDTALGGVFDRSKTRKSGALAPITTQDVADGIASVLDKSGKERVFVFPA